MKILRIILLPLVPVYALLIKIRNLFFDKNWYKTTRVNAKVVSVGNLTIGGSGKTPLVIYLLELLKAHNKKAGVLSRGYGRKSKGYLLVSDGNKIFTPVDKCGDEIYLTVSECNVPAAVSENRVFGANRLIEETGTEVIVLDDAYQHRWIERDVNLLIFEQRFLLTERHLLFPSGFLREPFESVKRADAVIINRKFSAKHELPEKIKSYFAGKNVYTAHYKAIGFVDVKRKEFHPVEDFAGQHSLIVSGIANPFSLINILNQSGVNTEDKLIFRDHKDYTLKEVQAIRKSFYSTNSHSVITTHKDAVKLNAFSTELDDIDVFYLKIEIEIDEKEKFGKFILSKIER